MGLLDLIETKKEELTKVLEKKNELENEIHELEKRVERKPDKLKNPDACFNPPLYFEKGCQLCSFYLRCMYHGRDNYGKLGNSTKK